MDAFSLIFMFFLPFIAIRNLNCLYWFYWFCLLILVPLIRNFSYRSPTFLLACQYLIFHRALFFFYLQLIERGIISCFLILTFIFAFFFLPLFSFSFLFHFRTLQSYHFQIFIFILFFTERYQPFYSWILELLLLFISFLWLCHVLIFQAFLNIILKLLNLQAFLVLRFLSIEVYFFHFLQAFFIDIPFLTFFFLVESFSLLPFLILISI